MAYNIRNVSKSQPCPICGKPDWCGYMPASDGGELLICYRDVTKANTLGRDGNFYVVVGVSRRGATIFEEANQRRAKEIARKGCYTYNNNENFKVSVPEVRTLTKLDPVESRSNEELDLIYRTMLSFLKLEPQHRIYLHNEGWTDEMIEKHGIVSFPEKDFTRFKYRKDVKSENPYRKKLAKLVMDKLGIDNLRGVPGAFMDSNGNWTFSGRSGILFPLPDIDHRFYRLRIRMDFRDVNGEIYSNPDGDDWYIENGKKRYISMSGVYTIENGEKVFDKSLGKYRNFASYYIDPEEEKNGFLVNIYKGGCEAGNNLGFYYNESRDDMHMAYLIEGEKKAIFTNEYLKAITISFPGVNSWSLLFDGKPGERLIDRLKQKGVHILVVAFDADKCKNQMVLAAEKQTVEAIRKEGFIIGVAEWELKYAKGIDDLLYRGYMPTFVAV